MAVSKTFTKLVETIKQNKNNTIMKVSKELNLQHFEFWAGAKDHSFTYSELSEIEFALEDIMEDPSETGINDLFWFEEEFLCECIGVDYENDYLER